MQIMFIYVIFSIKTLYYQSFVLKGIGQNINYLFFVFTDISIFRLILRQQVILPFL